jgi:hypothetical protein
MGRLLGRVLVVACMGVVAGLTYVGSASATVPATGRFTNPVSGIDDGVSATCGFQVLVTGTDTGSFQVFFDSTGTPVRLQIETVSTNTFSANGITIPFRSANKNTFNLINGTGTDIGLDIRVTIPGVGNLYLDRGRLVFDSNGNLIFEAGPHPSLHGDIDGLCAALTP